jgi:DNA-binding IclR family transcriptional regulator
MALLKTFNDERSVLGVTELSRIHGLQKSTVSRLLSTLERAGMVARDPDSGRYTLGLALVGLGVSVRRDLRQVAQALLAELCEQTQETVHIAVLDGDEVINIEAVHPESRQVRHAGWVGRRAPVHCSSTGKVLLAYRPQEDIERVIARGLPRVGPATITDADALRAELEAIRRRGLALAVEEFEEGLAALAAPIRDHAGRVIACVSVAGPSFRLVPAALNRFGALTIATADEISRRLGYVPPPAERRPAEIGTRERRQTEIGETSNGPTRR